MPRRQTEITFNLDGLEELRKKLGDQYVARVGILGGHAARTDEESGLTNSEIGVIHEFGSDNAGIPPRSICLMVRLAIISLVPITLPSFFGVIL